MGQFDEKFKRLQVEKPFLFGALLGLLMSVMFLITDIIFGEEVDVVETALMSLVAVIAMSMLIGSTKSRQRKSRKP